MPETRALQRRYKRSHFKDGKLRLPEISILHRLWLGSLHLPSSHGSFCSSSLTNTSPHHTFQAATGHDVPAPFGQTTVCPSAQSAVHPTHSPPLRYQATDLKSCMAENFPRKSKMKIQLQGKLPPPLGAHGVNRLLPGRPAGEDLDSGLPLSCLTLGK